MDRYAISDSTSRLSKWVSFHANYFDKKKKIKGEKKKKKELIVVVGENCLANSSEELHSSCGINQISTKFPMSTWGQ